MLYRCFCINRWINFFNTTFKNNLGLCWTVYYLVLALRFLQLPYCALVVATRVLFQSWRRGNIIPLTMITTVEIRRAVMVKAVSHTFINLEEDMSVKCFKILAKYNRQRRLCLVKVIRCARFFFLLFYFVTHFFFNLN